MSSFRAGAVVSRRDPISVWLPFFYRGENSGSESNDINFFPAQGGGFDGVVVISEFGDVGIRTDHLSFWVSYLDFVNFVCFCGHASYTPFLAVVLRSDLSDLPPLLLNVLHQCLHQHIDLLNKLADRGANIRAHWVSIDQTLVQEIAHSCL